MVCVVLWAASLPNCPTRPDVNRYETFKIEEKLIRAKRKAVLLRYIPPLKYQLLTGTIGLKVYFQIPYVIFKYFMKTISARARKETHRARGYTRQ
jgi:hypothetical protein